VQRTHGNHHRLAGLQAVPDERHYAGGEVGGIVPQECLVPIALLRSGRCECDDDPLLRTPARTTDVTEPVRLRASTVLSVSRPLPAGTAPQYRGRDRIRTLPKMVSKPMPERSVALHRSRSAKAPRRRAGRLKISQRVRKL
jgi:hypothetical protein